MKLSQRFKRLTFWNKLGVVGSVVGILAFILTVITLPIPKWSKPSVQKTAFTFSLFNPEKPTESLKLTNDCFTPHGWEVVHEMLGGVLIPIQIRQTNFLLTLRVHSSAFAERPEFFITVPAQWGVAAGFGWLNVVDEDGKAYSVSNGIGQPKELQSWGYRSPIDLLPGDGLTLPGILFTNLEELTLNPLKTYSPQIGGIVVIAKSKGLPPAGVGFRPFFLQTSNGYSHKPVAVTLFHTNNEAGAFFPFPLPETNFNEMPLAPEILKEMKK